MASVGVSDANRAVDRIVRSVQEGEPGGTWNISEIIKAGSLGHGTVVPGNFDLDLVVYSRSLTGDEIVTEGFDSALDILERHLDRKNPNMLTDKERTSRSQQFIFDGMIEVDLLVSPYWGDPKELYQFLRTIDPKERSKFSVSASKWQVRFFSTKDNQVKEFIKRAKAWRDSQEWGDRGKPKSYLLSILVLKAYEISRSKLPRNDPSTREIATQTTAEMKSIVKNHARADIYWEEYYQRSTYPDLFPQRLPRIVDPANPANNLHETGISGHLNKKCRDYGEGDGDWGKFVDFIDTLDLNVSVE